MPGSCHGPHDGAVCVHTEYWNLVAAPKSPSETQQVIADRRLAGRLAELHSSGKMFTEYRSPSLIDPVLGASPKEP